MESFYHNSVSEFDLNLLEHATTAHQANPTQCPEARELMIYRIKRRIKGTCKVIKRAKTTNEVLKIAQNELLETKTELADTKKLLCDKNEELKDSCIARNTYYDKAAKCESDLQIAKEQLKHYEDKDYDFETQKRVTEVHIDQIKALENMLAQKASNTKERAATLSQATKRTGIVEKKLARVLTDYVLPTIKKRDKWLEILVRKYLPKEKINVRSNQDLPDHSDDTSFDDGEPMSPLSPENNEDENQKTYKSPDATIVDHSKPAEVVLNNMEPPANNTLLNRNISLDFEYVESVDTGRGSSLASSDGDKSYHSPDYYINDSPLSAVPNICAKCNLPKSDAATSPFAQEISEIADSSATNNIKCRTCTLISKIDACTSPMSLDKRNVATDTADIIYGKYRLEKSDASTSPRKIQQGKSNAPTSVFDHLNNIKTVPISTAVTKTDILEHDQDETAINHNEISSKYSATSQFKTLHDIKSNTAEMIKNISRMVSPVKALTTISVDNNKQSVTTQFNIACEKSPQSLGNHNIYPNTAGTTRNVSELASPVEELTPDDDIEVGATHVNISSKESSAKLLHNKTINTAEITRNDSKTAGPVADLTTVLDDHQDVAIHPIISSIKSPKIPGNQQQDMIHNTENITRNISRPVSPDETDTTYRTMPNTELPKNSEKLHSVVLNTAEIANGDSRVDSPVEESTTMSDDDYDQASTYIRYNASGKVSPSIPTEVLDSITLNAAELNNISKRVELLEDVDTIYSDKYKAEHYSRFSIKKIPCNPTTLRDLTADTELDITSTLEEEECLELNNNNNIINDFGNDSEIQSILNNMRLSHKIITPIPKTPPRRASPIKTTVSRRELKYRLKKIMNEIAKDLYKTANRLICVPELLLRPDSDGIDNEDCFMLKSSNVHSSLENTQEMVSNEDVDNELNNEAQTVTRYVDMLQYDTEPEDLDQMASKETRYINKEDTSEKQSSNKQIKRSIEKPKCVILSNYNITKSGSEVSLKDKSMFDKISTNSNISQEKTKCLQATFINSASILNTADLEHIIEDNASNNVVEITQHNLESDDFEQDCSEGSYIQNDCKKLACNETRYEESPNKKRTMKKLTTLEKLRLKMVPKSKIRREIIPRPKKVLFKPTPIITIPKKKITESDTAATLNDKSVYENAVKIIAASKSKEAILKEARVIVEDCIIKMQNSDKKSLIHNVINKQNENIANLISPSSSNNKKRNLLLETNPKQMIADNLVPLKCKRVRRTTCDGTLPIMFCNESVLCSKIKRKSICGHQNLDDTDKKPVTRQDSKDNCTKIKRKGICGNLSLHDTESNILGNLDSNEFSDKLKRKGICGYQNLDDTESKKPTSLQESTELCNKIKRKGICGHQNSDDTEWKTPVSFEDLNENDEAKPIRSIKTSRNLQRSDSSNQLNGDCEPTKSKRRSVSSRQSIDKIGNTVIPDHIVSEVVVPKKRRRSSGRDSINNGIEQCVTDTDVSPVRTNAIISNHGNSDIDSRRDNKNPEMINSASIDPAPKNNFNEKNQTMNDDLCDSPSPQRVLRSSYAKQNIGNNLKTFPLTPSRKSSERNNIESHNSDMPESDSQNHNDRTISYADLGLFDNEELCVEEQNKTTEDPVNMYKNNMLCHMIEKYGRQNFKKRNAKKIPESKVNELSNKLETSIADIVVLPRDECKAAMKRLVADICLWDVKHFLVGLVAYLKDNGRKLELFNKITCPPAPAMTKQEQVLLFVIEDLQHSRNYRNIVQKILEHIEFALFALNSSPLFDVLESMSHFYALLCRNYQKMSRLRLFIVDAMYCLQFKSLVLIKQCLEVWSLVLPLAHMGLAKSPLVTTLVYLLHFYKFEDKYHRIEDIRFILRRKYSYELSDWNETKILDVIKTAVYELRENPLEKKMLRLSVIILAKRKGAAWCHNNIVKKMLEPMIGDECTPDVAKGFCVSLLGPLLKAYPNNMKVHYEMVTDYLFGLLDQKQPPKMQEAIVSSLICTLKQNDRVDEFVFRWNPKQISPEFRAVFIEYVRSKPVHRWKQVLSKIEL